MSFSLVEDELISASTTALTVNGRLLAKVDTLPGGIRDADTLREMVKAAPAVYWSFLSATPRLDSKEVELNTTWGAYFVASHYNRYATSRRGNERMIGVYDMLAKVLPVIHGRTIQNVGTLKIKQLENLFDLNIDRQGSLLYAATYELPMELPYEMSSENFSNFATYHAEHLLNGDTAAIDEVALPQT